MTQQSAQDGRNLAAQIRLLTLAFIGGRFVGSVSGRTFDTINPATGHCLGQIAECDAADVDLAVTAARSAFEAGVWTRQSPRDRKKCLLRLADLMDAIETIRWHAGAMIGERHLQRVLDYVEKGMAEGARLVLGGRRVRQESGGFFIEPTVFDAVRNDMSLEREEIFGPVLATMTFAGMDGAISITNDSPYGLAASVYTRDLATAHTMARAIRSGTVPVNCFTESEQAVPFGGFKQSGFGGRENSFMAHDQYTQTKTIWMQLR